MTSTPQITVALVRELLDSTAGDPVLYIDADGELAVDSSVHAPRGSIVVTREAAAEYFGERHVDGLDDDTIDELLPGTEDWVEHTLDVLND
ncbi:hypothetical protein ACF1D2_32955 [Streptomyces bacillaris]|uniref:hypothetical protein n=1 Tax=Streptomyces bacillaris TaxID=68179 RepID=UPI0036F96464